MWKQGLRKRHMSTYRGYIEQQGALQNNNNVFFLKLLSHDKFMEIYWLFAHIHVSFHLACVLHRPNLFTDLSYFPDCTNNQTGVMNLSGNSRFSKFKMQREPSASCRLTTPGSASYLSFSPHKGFLRTRMLNVSTKCWGSERNRHALIARGDMKRTFWYLKAERFHVKPHCRDIGSISSCLHFQLFTRMRAISQTAYLGPPTTDPYQIPYSLPISISLFLNANSPRGSQNGPSWNLPGAVIWAIIELAGWDWRKMERRHTSFTSPLRK